MTEAVNGEKKEATLTEGWGLPAFWGCWYELNPTMEAWEIADIEVGKKSYLQTLSGFHSPEVPMRATVFRPQLDLRTFFISE